MINTLQAQRFSNLVKETTRYNISQSRKDKNICHACLCYLKFDGAKHILCGIFNANSKNKANTRVGPICLRAYLISGPGFSKCG